MTRTICTSTTIGKVGTPRFARLRTWPLVYTAAILLLVVCGNSVFNTRLHAQTNYGSIVGTVSDSTGATLAGATVTLKNNGTDATQTATTGSGGSFSFINLNPGSYSLTMTHQGFSTKILSQVDVRIGGSSRVDAQLTAGGASESMTVTAAPPDLQTDSSSLEGVVEGRQVLDSPLNGRNVNNLLDFVPGVAPGGGTQASTMSNGGSGNFQVGGQTQAIAYGNYQIGGGFSGQSLFFIDGVLSNVPENNVNSLVPTQDAVQEFRVSTNNVSAEFGGFAGGVIQIGTKSGTNQFHGSAYEYFRNTVLNANDWFSNHTGLARPPLHQNQFGVNLGGPIVKDKVFFFFSWEREKLTSGSITTFTLPTTAEVGGDFSALLPATVIYDPTTGLPFPNNSIAGRIDPTAARIITLVSPAPNRPGLVNNFVATAPIEGLQDQYNARVDYNLSKSDSLFARYTFWNPHNGNSDPLGTKTGAGPTGNTTHEAVVGNNHIFNATTIADLRLAYLQNYNFQVPLSNNFNMSTIGPAYAALQSQVVNNQGLLPGLGIQGYSIGAELSQLYWLNTIYSINGSLTKILGRHTIKVGGIWRQIKWTNYGNNQGIGLNALPSFTASSSLPNSGNALASFLLGIPSSVGISQVGTWRAFLHPYGFYGTDTFQASNKLTLNLGLRWEQPSAYSEVNDLNTVLQPNAANPLGTISNPVLGTNQALTGNLAFVNSPQYPSRREEALHWHLFSPRVGFAYRASDKTVVRSGYGIAFLPAELTADSPGGSPINSAGTNLSNIPGVAPVTTVSNPFPNGILLPSGRNPEGLIAVLGQSVGSRLPNQSYGYVQQWNMGVQQTVGNNSTFTLAYAGAKGTHLTLSSGFTGTGVNLNQLPDQYLSRGSALLDQVPNPFFGILAPGTLGGPTISEGNLLKPHPQYQSFTQSVPRYGASTYNALQSTFIRRFSNSGILQVAYTWSKLLSNTDNTSSFQDGQGGLGVVQDYNNLAAEKSVSQQDYAQNAVINYGIDLPFGTNQKFLSNANTITNAVLGGWRVNGITTFRSGTPIAMVAASNALNQFFGAGNIRPNYVAGCTRQINGSASSRASKWFNTACFTQPGNFAFGNESRVDSALRSAGSADWDFSATKTIKITEWSNLQFITQFFNIFNRAQFAPPDSNLADPSFGQVTRQANNPRLVQFALRYSF